MNAHPTPTPPGPAPTYIWTWVDAHGYTITEAKKPPLYLNSVAYMTVVEHNRIIESMRTAAVSMLNRRTGKSKGSR